MIRCEDPCPYRSTNTTKEGVQILCAKDEKKGAVRVGIIPIVTKGGKPMIDEAFLDYMWCLSA